jgi:hypothetical protein
VAAGVAAAVLVPRLVPDLSPLAGLVVKSVAGLGVYLAVLLATGFFRPTERAFLHELSAHVRQRRVRAVSTRAE